MREIDEDVDVDEVDEDKVQQDDIKRGSVKGEGFGQLGRRSVSKVGSICCWDQGHHY